MAFGGLLGVFLFSGDFHSVIDINRGVELPYFEWASLEYGSLIFDGN